MNDWLSFEQTAQWVSIIASAFIVFGYFSTSDVRAKKILMVGSTLFSIHFFMLGAMTAMTMNIVNIFRVGLSIKLHKSKTLFFIFATIYILAGLFTYETFIHSLPVLASLFGCIGMFLLSGIRFRLLCILGSLCWLVHNIYVMSIGGISTEIFVLTAHLVTIYRLNKNQKHD